MQLAIQEIVLAKRHRKDLGDLDALAASLRECGLIQPLILNSRKELVAGLRRLKAAQRLGWSHVEVHVAESFDDLLNHLRAEYEENRHRKEFTPSEAVNMTSAIWALEEKRSRERQQEGRTASGQKPRHGYSPRETVSDDLEDSDPRENFPRVGKTSDIVAETVGMSGRTLVKARAVVEAAEADPETFGPVQEEMDRSGKVDPAYQQVKGHAHAQARRTAYDDLHDLFALMRRRLGNLADRRGSLAEVAAALPKGQRRMLRADLEHLHHTLQAIVDHLAG